MEPSLGGPGATTAVTARPTMETNNSMTSTHTHTYRRALKLKTDTHTHTHAHTDAHLN